MTRRSPADDLPIAGAEGPEKGVSPGPASRSGCLSEDDAFDYVRRPASGPLDAAVQTHLDGCELCRILVGEAARALAGGESPYGLTSEARESQPLTLAVGEVIMSRFEILRFEARGGMGEVYEARDSILKEVVALKTLVSTALDDQRANNRLLAEVRLARQVTHPNVCRILEFGLHHPKSSPQEAIPFLTMEFLRGETLGQRIARQGKLDPADIAALLPQIVAGLAAIHAAGIVHRDIKPQNIFLLPGTPERVVLTDFGLARGLEPSAQSLTGPVLVGTVDYMAPEQLEGKPATPSFDVYAVGVVLFEMLTGRKPFVGKSAIATAVERFRKPPPLPSTIVPDLDPIWDVIVGGCLKPDAAKRFQSAEQILVPGLSAVGRRKSKARVTRRVAAAAAAALLLAGASAAWLRAGPPWRSDRDRGSRGPDDKERGQVLLASQATSKALTRCTGGEDLPYVISAQYNMLYRFDPMRLSFTKIGMLKCPTGAGVNAMTVDRDGYAWVNYLDEGKIYKVNLKTLACEPTPYEAGGGIGFSNALSLQFVTKGRDSDEETLFVSDHTGDAEGKDIGKGAAKANPSSLKLTYLGPFTGQLAGRRCELSGSRDGRLFGFFEGKPAILAEIDKTTGATPDVKVLTDVATNGAYAFSFWGGYFWLYTTLPAPNHSKVTRYDPRTGEAKVVVPGVGFQIVSSGVSNCAPMEMPSSSRAVTQIATGAQHSCALFTDGAVRCWGDNSHGQLGYGHKNTIGDDETPASAGDVQVGGSVRQIATGDFHTCALLDTGKVRCWGNSAYGQLGHGDLKDIGDDEVPSSAGDLDIGGPVRQLSLGGPHSCALLDTGKVRCWGRGDGGHLGYGNRKSIGDDEPPSAAGDVDVGGRVIEIAAGSHTCALLETGAVRCWGGGNDGRLGYGNVKNIGKDDTPASAGDIQLGGKARQITLGRSHTCALLDTGKIRCWGGGDLGQLGYPGNENIGNDETPASVGDVNVGTARQVSAGGYDTCALLESGRVRCWGLRAGNLSAGTGDIDVGTRVRQVSVGGAHTCVLLDTGKVRCWGDNHHGQLGTAHGKDAEQVTTAPVEDVPLF